MLIVMADTRGNNIMSDLKFVEVIFSGGFIFSAIVAVVAIAAVLKDMNVI